MLEGEKTHWIKTTITPSPPPQKGIQSRCDAGDLWYPYNPPLSLPNKKQRTRQLPWESKDWEKKVRGFVCPGRVMIVLQNM